MRSLCATSAIDYLYNEVLVCYLSYAVRRLKKSEKLNVHDKQQVTSVVLKGSCLCSGAGCISLHWLASEVSSFRGQFSYITYIYIFLIHIYIYIFTYKNIYTYTFYIYEIIRRRGLCTLAGLKRLTNNFRMNAVLKTGYNSDDSNLRIKNARANASENILIKSCDAFMMCSTLRNKNKKKTQKHSYT